MSRTIAASKGFARTWLTQGKPFRGMICWPRAHCARMTPGNFVEAFEELARQDEPFVYPIVHIKPKN